MTPVQVMAEGEEPDEDPIAAAADAIATEGPISPLSILRGRRKEALSKLYKDFAIPRWEDTLGVVLWARYRPADPALYSRTIQRLENDFNAAVKKNPKGGDQQWTTKANADVLVKSCIAVYGLAIGQDPPEGELPDELPDFSSEQLALDLEIPVGNAISTVRALYQTDADLLLAVNQLLDWSGQYSKTTGDGDDFLAL